MAPTLRQLAVCFALLLNLPSILCFSPSPAFARAWSIRGARKSMGRPHARLGGGVKLRMAMQEAEEGGAGGRGGGGQSTSVMLTREWFASSNVMGDLLTDDGIPVAQLSQTSRFNWWNELLTLWGSRVLERITNRMAFTIACSIAVTTFINLGDMPSSGFTYVTEFEIPGWPHELIGGFLSILLVFRTDQAYDRFWEGRRKWAELSSTCRDMGRIAISNLDRRTAAELLASIAVFPVTLKQHLRGTSNSREIATVINTYLPANSSLIDIVASSRTMPVTVLLSMSNCISKLRLAPRHEHLEIVWQLLEQRVDKLASIVSDCEKIKCTPLPLSYSRYASRFFSIYTLTLPFALVKDTSPVLVPFITAFVSWVLFVTDEIGHVIEEPFGNGLAKDPDTISGKGQVTDQDIRKLFERIDADQSGFITIEEIAKELQRTLGIELSEEEAARVMSKMDLNGDGTVDYEEFNMAWKLASGATSVEVKQLETLPLGMYCDSILRELLFHWQLSNKHWDKEEVEPQASAVKANSKERKMFEALDFDSSGMIEREELQKALSGSGLSRSKVEEVFEDMDQNKDGLISYEEFLAALTVTDVLKWLEGVGLEEFQSAFYENDIDGKVLVSLSNEDLKSMGISSLGKRKAILSRLPLVKKQRQPPA
mmetsp:Transcript_40403/g.127182  ORF Transcript_40403/g.127182 Transcript_40403/m.127182 type:complete len:654 (-) Transcript_40403:18-1979(-)